MKIQFNINVTVILGFLIVLLSAALALPTMGHDKTTWEEICFFGTVPTVVIGVFSIIHGLFFEDDDK